MVLDEDEVGTLGLNGLGRNGLSAGVLHRGFAKGMLAVRVHDLVGVLESRGQFGDPHFLEPGRNVAGVVEGASVVFVLEMVRGVGIAPTVVVEVMGSSRMVHGTLGMLAVKGSFIAGVAVVWNDFRVPNASLDGIPRLFRRLVLMVSIPGIVAVAVAFMVMPVLG